LTHPFPISADGNTIAVGGTGEFIAAAGINANQADSSAPGSGAVYIFMRNGSTDLYPAGVHQGLERGDGFDASVGLSADGNTLAVCAKWRTQRCHRFERQPSRQHSGRQQRVYLFPRTGIVRSQQA